MNPPHKVFKSSPFNLAASAADTEIVAAEAGTIIRVVSLYAVTGGTQTDLTVKSKAAGVSSVAISPLIPNAPNGGVVLGENYSGWFDTAVGAALVATTGSGSITAFQCNYMRMLASEA